ncbi:MAG: HD domain-containing phosphohydrolase [Nitrospirota bacterium]
MNKSVQLKRLLFSMESLVDLGQEVSSSKELAKKMKAALYMVTGIFSVPTAAVFVYDPQKKCFLHLVDKGLRGKSKKEIRLTVVARHIKRLKMNDPHDMHALAKTMFYRQNQELFAKLQTKIFIPLWIKGNLVGAITLGKKLGNAVYRSEDRDILRIIAHQTAMTLYNARLFLELTKKVSENKRLYTTMQKIYHDTIQAFAAAIDAKDDYTKDHSSRVANYSVAIARELGWKPLALEGMHVAGLLHDIGKIIVDREIINKGEKLTTPEECEIKKHPQISYDILSKVKFPWKDIEYFVRHHHERVDGKGYPDALGSSELSEGVKILALADAFDAMTTDRPYRRKLTLEEAYYEILRCSGTQFDPHIIHTFFMVLKKELQGNVKDPLILPSLNSGQPLPDPVLFDQIPEHPVAS